MDGQPQNGQQQEGTPPAVVMNGAGAPADDGKTLHQQTKEANKAAELELRDTWGTPQKLFDTLNAEFNFTLDVCALAWNAKCARYYGPDSQLATNGLTASWAGERWFGNFPFLQLNAWLKNAWRWYSPEARAAGCLAGLGVGLMPASRTEQEDWQTLVEPYRDKWDVAQKIGVYLETRFITTPGEKNPYGRTKFVPPAGVKPSSPTFGTVLLIFRPL